jgi:hypothetical protein
MQFCLPSITPVFPGIVTVYNFAHGPGRVAKQIRRGFFMAIPSLLPLRRISTLSSCSLADTMLLSRNLHVEWVHSLKLRVPGPIIALSCEPLDTSDIGTPATLVSLLRATTSNENIYAEQCDLASIRTVVATNTSQKRYFLTSIRLFVTVLSQFSRTRAQMWKTKRYARPSVCHTTSPFIRDGACPARLTSNYTILIRFTPRQPTY